MGLLPCGSLRYCSSCTGCMVRLCGNCADRLEKTSTTATPEQRSSSFISRPLDPSDLDAYASIVGSCQRVMSRRRTAQAALMDITCRRNLESNKVPSFQLSTHQHCSLEMLTYGPGRLANRADHRYEVSIYVLSIAPKDTSETLIVIKARHLEC